MTTWPEAPAGLEAVPEAQENHQLDVYLENGRVTDALLDGESVWPTWFKLEFKEDGQVSAKVKGLRLATRYGDTITVKTG